MNNVCGTCAFWVRVGCEDVEVSDTRSELRDYGVCGNINGELSEGNMWVQLNTNNRFTRVWEFHEPCRHYEEKE